MSNQEQQSFTIKCQCSAYKNGMLITTKKKSKLSNLVLNGQSKTISIVPLNSKEENIVFQLKQLKHIHRKFIGEGKITLQFSEQFQKIGSTQSVQNKTERLSQIFIQAASSQNLELLMRKIVELKKSVKCGSKSVNKKQGNLQKEHMTQDQNKNAVRPLNSTQMRNRQGHSKSDKFIQNMVERKRDPLRYNMKLKQYQDQQEDRVKLSRKQLIKLATKGDQQQQLVLRTSQGKPMSRPELDIMQLPSFLLQKIFQFTLIQLPFRLISKRFDKFVIKNVQSIHFRDQVDELTFNKLGKYVPNISGRLRNVRSIQLIDLYDQSQLQRNRAKSLYLGEWKQMSKNNIKQIKGLRIHTLAMPYQIKFEFHNIYGIKLRELHLCSKHQVTTPNSLITDQNVLYLFRHVKQLQAFSIPYLNSGVLEELTTQLKEKAAQLKCLRIGSLNQNCKKQQNWFLFHIYEQLKTLKVQRVLKGGIIKKQARYKLTFPLYIDELQVGPFLSQQTITALPMTLARLKLTGDLYYNKDVSDIYLPYLKLLDVSQCPLVRPSVIDVLQKCTKLKMITNWQKQDVEYWRQMAQNKDIQITTVRGLIKR